MTLADAMERIADLEEQVALLEYDFGRALGLLTALGEAAGVDPGTTVPQPEPEMGQLLAFPAGGRGDTQTGATGRAARRVTADTTSRRASHLGTAS